MKLCDGNGKMVTVSMVRSVSGVGVFSPATMSGQIVVDGILCSAYAKPGQFVHVDVSDKLAHTMIHQATAFLRLSWWMRLQVPASILPLPETKQSSEPTWAVRALKAMSAPILDIVHASQEWCKSKEM